MKLLRREFLELAGAVVVVPALPQRASAQDYPIRPVHIIIGDFVSGYEGGSA
jgi:hypothetical protein